MKTPIDIEGYLSSKGIDYRTTGNNQEIFTHCFIHGEQQKGREPGRLYINNSGGDKHGVFQCKKCGAQGAFWRIQRWFGDDPESGVVNSPSTHHLIKRAAKLCYDNLRDRDIEWLINARGLTEETIRSRGLGHTPGGTWMYTKLKDDFSPEELLAAGLLNAGAAKEGDMRDHFFGSGITIPYFAGPDCVNLRWRNLEGDKPKYLSLGGSATRLFNSNTTFANDAEEFIICEGEFDAILMEQLGYHAVAIPGATTWDSAWNDYAAEAKRVWVICDPDEEGLRGADKIESALGSKARIIHLPIPDGVEAKKVDPTYLVVQEGWNRNHFDVLFKRAAREDSLLRTPSQARAQFEADEKVGGLQTGFSKLDKTIGGIKRPNLVVPVARTNVGKTLFLINLAMRMSMVPGQENIKILLLTLEQTGGEWFDRVRRIWNFYNQDCPPALVNEAAAKYWDERLMYVEKNQLGELEIRQCIEDFELEMGSLPDIILVDYLGYLARGYKAEKTTDRVSAAAQSLKGIAKDINRPIVVPAQGNRGAEHGREVGLDDARDSGEIDNVADIVVGLWSQDTMKGKSAADRTGELVAKFAKTRGKGKGKEVKFFFAPLTLVWIPEEEKDTVPLVKREISWDNDGDITWQEAIEAHRLGQPPRGRKSF